MVRKGALDGVGAVAAAGEEGLGDGDDVAGAGAGAEGFDGGGGGGLGGSRRGRRSGAVFLDRKTWRGTGFWVSVVVMAVDKASVVVLGMKFASAIAAVLTVMFVADLGMMLYSIYIRRRDTNVTTSTLTALVA